MRNSAQAVEWLTFPAPSAWPNAQHQRPRKLGGARSYPASPPRSVRRTARDQVSITPVDSLSTLLREIQRNRGPGSRLRRANGRRLGYCATVRQQRLGSSASTSSSGGRRETVTAGSRPGCSATRRGAGERAMRCRCLTRWCPPPRLPAPEAKPVRPARLCLHPQRGGHEVVAAGRRSSPSCRGRSARSPRSRIRSSSPSASVRSRPRRLSTATASAREPACGSAARTEGDRGCRRSQRHHRDQIAAWHLPDRPIGAPEGYTSTRG